ncbi:hypothetical protein GD1_217 [Paraglaciecola Antarctic GD virus 1]|nr:hypothetical protein GD1_217 [Paraglaciecola Antarctic GD virus 1]
MDLFIQVVVSAILIGSAIYVGLKLAVTFFVWAMRVVFQKEVLLPVPDVTVKERNNGIHQLALVMCSSVHYTNWEFNPKDPATQGNHPKVGVTYRFAHELATVAYDKGYRHDPRRSVTNAGFNPK